MKLRQRRQSVARGCHPGHTGAINPRGFTPGYRRTPLTGLLRTCAILPLFLACASAGPPAVSLRSCQLPGVPFNARCGTVEVWENRETRAGRKIPLHVVVLPGQGKDRAPDPVFYLEGGPGLPATESAAALAEDLAPVLAERDLVLIDQRGTGQSNPLDCPDPEISAVLPDPAALRTCRAELERKADLTRYTTADAAGDLEEVRRALGYEQINLIGSSYGTVLAQVFLRLWPESARSAVLIGPVDPTDPYPLSVARDIEAGLDRLFADCAADTACHGAFPRLKEDLATVLRRLEAGAVRVEISDPEAAEGSPTVTVEMTADLLRATLYQRLYSAEAAARVPLSIHRAAAGDFSGLARAALVLRRHMASGRSRGQILTIDCSEGLPPDRLTPEAVAGATAGTFQGDLRVRVHQAACAVWPRADRPEVTAQTTEPLRAATPVLVLGGELDPILPPRHGEAIARHLPNSLLVLVAGESHAPLNECTRGILRDVLAQGSIERLGISCAAEGKRPPFLLPE